ncbi:MAG: peptidylprolyl isomerase [Alphaproteobacteria bacterium]|nr:peptidylprolyl isomerase [Alphaproteobacteria bacterium]
MTHNRSSFILIAALGAALAIAASVPVHAQRAAPAAAPVRNAPVQSTDSGADGQVERIAAVVNDDVVSVYDINNRIDLVLATSGMPNSPEVRERLRPQVMRTLIDERLELQEAKRINALATDADVTAAVGRIESANHMPPGSLVPALTREGISADSLNSQIKAGLSWQKVVERQLRPSLGVGDDEIDEVLDRIKADKGTTEYLLAEIYLAVDSPDQDAEIKNRMLDMIEQMHRGTAFSAVAQQFSQAASASQGGDIGWVERGQLDPEVLKAIEDMDINHATMPVRTPTGYYVYLLRDKRTLAAADPEDATVTLAQLVLPLEAGATADDIKTQKELAETVRQDVKGCDDLKRAAGELHVEYADPTPDLKIRDLNPAIRPAVLNLKVGEASQPLQSDTGITLVMACDRKDPPEQMPSRDQIADNLTRQRLDLIARRYLSDLRRQAFIDVRV